MKKFGNQELYSWYNKNIMKNYPEFPDFKPLEITDRDFIREILWSYQPEVSELTFTNFFIWRNYYHFYWTVLHGCFITYYRDRDGSLSATQPVGNGDRVKAVSEILKFLRKEKEQKQPEIRRADKRIVSELIKSGEYQIEPNRDYFDYVYRTEDLIKLPGRKYHNKRNHISQFIKKYEFQYRPLQQEFIPECLNLSNVWCTMRKCEEDPGLMGEQQAIFEALNNFDQLSLNGGVILVNGRVEAFSIGELLNKDTAVIHIEKANPEIPHLYALINQQFAENTWLNTKWINREEDLGEENLRRAKESYYPDHLVEKFTISKVNPAD